MPVIMVGVGGGDGGGGGTEGGGGFQPNQNNMPIDPSIGFDNHGRRPRRYGDQEHKSDPNPHCPEWPSRVSLMAIYKMSASARH